MMKSPKLALKFAFLCLIVLVANAVSAQKKLPVIQATSPKVSITDGGFRDKNAWTLSPETKPDIYTADRTRASKWVTFSTDVDSIRVKVKPGSSFDFVILLNGKDSCFTRIQSAIPLENTASKIVEHSDTIPFQLMENNAICVQAILDDRDTLKLHFDASSFDIRLTTDAVLHKTQLLAHQPDALSGKAKPDFNDMASVAKVQLGNLTLSAPTVLATRVTAGGMDGRFGWNLFEGKIVEINYDQMCLVIHSKLPKHLAGYSKSKLIFLRSFPCVEGEFAIAHQKYGGTFLLDTGSDQALILDSSWVAKQGFPQDLKLLKSSELSDPRGVKYVTKIVLAPQFQLQKWATTDIPTYLLPSKNPVGLEVNYLGNDLLKRFNTLLDFKTDRIYLKPNRLMGVPYISRKMEF